MKTKHRGPLLSVRTGIVTIAASAVAVDVALAAPWSIISPASNAQISKNIQNVACSGLAQFNLTPYTLVAKGNDGMIYSSADGKSFRTGQTFNWQNGLAAPMGGWDVAKDPYDIVITPMQGNQASITVTFN